MTPSDDEILAAVRANVPEHCCMWDAENKLIDAWGLDRDEMIALYRAAYSAGMEAAANIAMWYAMTADVVGDNAAAATIDRAVGAIRAANGREGKP